MSLLDYTNLARQRVSFPSQNGMVAPQYMLGYGGGQMVLDDPRPPAGTNPWPQYPPGTTYGGYDPLPGARNAQGISGSGAFPDINIPGGAPPGYDIGVTLPESNYLDERDRLLEWAYGLFQNSPTPYGGNRVAPFTADQQQAFDIIRGIVTDPRTYSSTELADQSAAVASRGLSRIPGILESATGPEIKAFAQAARDANLRYLDPSFLDVENNPYIKGYIDLANEEVTRNFNERVLPGLFSNQISNGMLGSSRDILLARPMAADRLNDDLARFTFGTLSDQYNKNQQAQLGALETAPRTARMEADTALSGSIASGNIMDLATRAVQQRGAALSQGLSAGQALLGVGTMEQELEQAIINADMARYYEAEYGPYWAVSGYANILAGQQFGTVTAQPFHEMTAQQPSAGARLLGGAATGAGIASMLFPGNAIAIGAGAIFGGALGLF